MKKNVVKKVLFVAWQSPQTRTIHPVARLVAGSAPSRFELTYIKGAVKAKAEGFVPFAGMPKLEGVYRSKTLFPFLANRLMSQSRPDYAEYLDRLNLLEPAEPLQLLSRSQGRKPTDYLELFGPPCFREDLNKWEHLFFVRGVRHEAAREKRAAKLKSGQRLYLRSQPENDWDPPALQVLLNEYEGEVGFVPATLLPDLEELRKLGSEMEAKVVRVNPIPAPAHQRLLVKLLVDHRENYIPLSTEDYQPLAEEASQLTQLKDFAC